MLNKVSCLRLFCENCSHFILKWFQSNSFGSVLLRGVHHKYAKNSHFKNFESAPYLTSMSMPLTTEGVNILFGIAKWAYLLGIYTPSPLDVFLKTATGEVLNSNGVVRSVLQYNNFGEMVVKLYGTCVRDGFKTQLLVDRRFRPVPPSFYRSKQWQLPGTGRNRRSTSSSVRFQPVSIVLNNDNRPEPEGTAGQPAVGFWSCPL